MKKIVEKLNRSLSWQGLSDTARWTLEQGIAIQQIPAPTFDEAERADYVQAQFLALGLQDVTIDSVYNVYGRLPGQLQNRPALMLSAHLDTVFDKEVDLSIRRENGTIYGPGLGDNSIAAASLLGLVQLLGKTDHPPLTDIWFVATSREEGLGDLGGMKAAYERLKSRIWAVINVEGLAFGHIYHAGIAVRRLKIIATADGGHSWLHFGRASAIHAIVQLGAKITALKVPNSPRTTYNIGLIQGGQSINSIAGKATMWLDMRSEKPESLADLEKNIRTLIDETRSDDISLTVDVVGDRPAGFLSIDHALVQASMTALKQVGVRGHLQTGSTDGNVPLADSCPAVTIGITQGGNAHRLDEYIEVQPIEAGLKQLLLLTIAAAQYTQEPT